MPCLLTLHNDTDHPDTNDAACLHTAINAVVSENYSECSALVFSTWLDDAIHLQSICDALPSSKKIACSNIKKILTLVNHQRKLLESSVKTVGYLPTLSHCIVRFSNLRLIAAYANKHKMGRKLFLQSNIDVAPFRTLGVDDLPLPDIRKAPRHILSTFAKLSMFDEPLYTIHTDDNESSTVIRSDESDALYAFRNHWEFYASRCPLWQHRLGQYNATFDDHEKPVFPSDDHLESFYETYGLDPDEQSRDVLRSCLAIGKKRIHFNEFCATITCSPISDNATTPRVAESKNDSVVDDPKPVDKTPTKRVIKVKKKVVSA